MIDSLCPFQFLLAIVSEFWLLAMTVWMLGELFGNDQQRFLAALVFCCGFVAYAYFLVTASKLREYLGMGEIGDDVGPAKRSSVASEVRDKKVSEEDKEALLESR